MWKLSGQPFAQEAEQRAQEPSDAANAIGRLADRVAELKSQLATLRPAFEVSRAYLFGGAGASTVAVYTLPAPYDTACEYAVLSVAFLDTGVAALSSAGDPSGILAGTPNLTQQGLYGVQIFAAGGEATHLPSEFWQPLQANGNLSLAVNSSSKICYVTVQFRRRVNPAGVPNVGF